MSFQPLKQKFSQLALVLTVCSAVGFPTSAHAEKSNRGRSHDNHSYSDERGHQSGRSDRNDSSWDEREGYGHYPRYITEQDRQVIRRYIQEHHRDFCPPGLAKKHNGCVPPGQLHRYEIGRRLPDGILYVPAPYYLKRHLRPLQPEYEYILVDNDLLLLSKRDQLIVDAVAYFSDLMN
ncbi:MAG: hypothetical protein K9G62_03415 [Alphaproteobacteria bacterium]|nr:hypothetical protein [Alphaproteobacteria bacterium]